MENTKEKIKVGFVSLGCDKNRVDTEKIISSLAQYNFEFVAEKEKADVIVINTCAFLKSAREEASDTILEMSKLKETSLQKLIVVGCLPLLQKEKIKEQFPKVDVVVLPDNYQNMPKIIFDLFNIKLPNHTNLVKSRFLTTPKHFAYLKIADGCNNRCAFCKIPFIKGNYKSVEIDNLVDEATALCENGVKEIILVAQDITRYGIDLYGKIKLKELLQKLTKIKKLSWLRLLYCYPDMIDDDLIEEIKENPKIVKYIDIPLQHASDNVLKAMKRISTQSQIVEIIKKLKKIPDLKIRSTFMVGFPGETKKDFSILCKFLKSQKLDNVGFFKYSREEGTSSFDLPFQIDEKTKDERLKAVQKIQTKIATSNLKKLKHKTFKVVVDDFDLKHNFYIGRPYFSAPDIDFEVLFNSYKKLKIGAFADVKIKNFKQGYLIGEVV